MEQIKKILINGIEYQIVDETALHEGDMADLKNGYSIFTTNVTINEIALGNAIIDIAAIYYWDNRGFQVGDLVLDSTNGNLWRITGQNEAQLNVSFVSSLKGTDGNPGENGVGIDVTSIRNTVSTMDGGENKLSFNLTDGTPVELIVYNGKTGRVGETGPVGPIGPTGATGKSAYAYAQDGGYTGTESEFSAKLAEEIVETDPTVPAWAKASTKPTYTKSEIGLGNVDNVKQYSASNPPPYPVTKINNKTGAVTLSASDVGADASGTANSTVSTHNTSTSAHADIREQISQLSSEIVDEVEARENAINDLKAEGVQQVPLFANSIEECTDTTKLYVLPDGFIYAYTKAETTAVAGWSENLVPTSIDTDGSIFNGKGYKDGTRLNSSGVVVTQEHSTAIGFIPAKKGDKFQITGVYFGHSQTNVAVYGYISTYNASKTKLISASIDSIAAAPSSYNFTITPLKSSGTVSSTDITTIDFTNTSDDLAFVRFSSAISAVNLPGVSGANMVVQKWIEGGTEITEGWHSTGHAFVPADYEGDILKNKADIINLTNKSLEHEERIAELEENGLSGSASNIIPEGLEWLEGYSIPRLILNGSTDGMTKENAVTLNYECADKDGTKKTGSCTLKWQGSSSLAWEKKNYTIKFDNALEVVSGWGSQKKYCLKANFIDHSHARNVVSAKLWGQVAKSRTSVDSRLTALPNAGAVDGFPVLIILNGEFHGLYTWNIPKDGWMFGMSGTTSQQAIVCADKYVDATSFKALAVLDGSDFELEYSSDDQSEWVKTSLNRMIQAVMDSDGTDLDTNVAKYIDIDSAIDYIIHTVLIEAADCIQKNYILATYDGIKWFFSAYDMDSTFGLHWDGKDFSHLESVPTFQTWTGNKLMNLLWTKKRDTVNARYAQLRANAMSEHNVAYTFWNFGCLIPKSILLKDVEKWTSIPSTSVNDIHQILTQYRLRCMLADEWIKG